MRAEQHTASGNPEAAHCVIEMCVLDGNHGSDDCSGVRPPKTTTVASDNHTQNDNTSVHHKSMTSGGSDLPPLAGRAHNAARVFNIA